MEHGAGEPRVVRRAVVVDDDPQLRRLVSLLLEIDLDIEVSAAVGTAAEAEEAVVTHQPDVVVLDHFLSDRVTGLALAPKLKALAPESRIVVFSAVVDPKLEAPGVDAVVNKMGIELLPALISSLLGLAVLEQLDPK